MKEITNGIGTKSLKNNQKNNHRQVENLKMFLQWKITQQEEQKQPNAVVRFFDNINLFNLVQLNIFYNFANYEKCK